MSVPEPFRNESGAEFLNNFHDMRRIINNILMRDFGLKMRNYDIELISNIYQINAGDVSVLREMEQRYGMNSFAVKKVPDWRIDSWRNSVIQIMDRIAEAIELGNSVNIVNDELYCEKYIERSRYFEIAIGQCHVLKDKFHEILKSMPNVKLGEYEDVADKLKREIGFLKGVKKRDANVYQTMASKYMPREYLPVGINADDIIPPTIGQHKLYFYGDNINSLGGRPNGTFSDVPYALDVLRLQTHVKQVLSILSADEKKVELMFVRKTKNSRDMDFNEWKIQKDI